MALLLDFTSGTLPGGVTYARFGPAPRVNSSGVTEDVGTDVPRFDYDKNTLALRGLLIEAGEDHASGRVIVAGAVTTTLGDTTLSAAGTVLTHGAASPTLDDTALAGGGSVKISGAAAPTLADTTLSGAGAVVLTGTASITLDGTTIAAAGGNFIEAITPVGRRLTLATSRLGTRRVTLAASRQLSRRLTLPPSRLAQRRLQIVE
jgi:hypothetical protein